MILNHYNDFEKLEKKLTYIGLVGLSSNHIIKDGY